MSNATIERLGHDDVWERDLYLLEVTALEDLPHAIRTSAERYACLVVADARPLSDGQMYRLAVGLLSGGAVYLCAWGPSCERVHDIFDDAVLMSETSQAEESVVMTTWHDGPLDDALLFLLTGTRPAEAYADSCRANLVVVIGDAPGAEVVRRALTDPSQFIARMSA